MVKMASRLVRCWRCQITSFGRYAVEFRAIRGPAALAHQMTLLECAASLKDLLVQPVKGEPALWYTVS